MSNNKNFLEGKKAFDEGLFRLAVSFFTKAIETEENPYIYYERAVSYIHLKRYVDALADFNTALQLQPDNPFRYSSRAYVKEIMGDIDGAINDYYACIKLDPNDAIAYNNLGLLEEKKGRVEQAKKLIKQADKLAAKHAYLNSNTNNTNKPTQPNNKHETNSSKTQIIKDVFTSKKTLNEFLNFIINGFKLK